MLWKTPSSNFIFLNAIKKHPEFFEIENYFRILLIKNVLIRYKHNKQIKKLLMPI